MGGLGGGADLAATAAARQESQRRITVCWMMGSGVEQNQHGYRGVGGVGLVGSGDRCVLFRSGGNLVDSYACRQLAVVRAVAPFSRA